MNRLRLPGRASSLQAGLPTRTSTSTGMTFRQALDSMGNAQKPGRGVPAYTRWVNRRLARYAAAAAVRLSVGPNTVSLTSALLSGAGLGVLLLGPATPATGFCAAGLLAAGYVLDSADGQVARVTGTGSPAGEWLDHVLDSVRVPAIHVCTYVGLSRDPSMPGWLTAVPLVYAVMSAGHFMSQILSEQLHRQARLRGADTTTARPVAGDEGGPARGPRTGEDGEPAGALRSLVALPTDTGALCWVFVLWGFPVVFVGAYGALFVVNAAITIASVGRKHASLKSLERPAGIVAGNAVAGSGAPAHPNEGAPAHV